MFRVALLGCFLASCSLPNPHQKAYEEALSRLEAAPDGYDRFIHLNDAAKETFNVGEFEAAREYARELLALAPLFPDDWNYGNAIHDGHLVLGRLALREGRRDEAKRRLIISGKTPGSPQLDTFGPNLRLAEDLLKDGERDVVIEYFKLCSKFWENEDGRLDRWTREISQGTIPDFKANRDY